MPKNLRNSAIYCPIVDEFHVRNVLGCREKKVWMFGDIVTSAAGLVTKSVTLSSISSGVITSLRSYVVQVQKMSAAPVNDDFVYSKTSSGFTLSCDPASDYSVMVMGTENNSYATAPYFEPRWIQEGGGKKSGKWAKDYCPGCKQLDFWAICGSTSKDLATFSFCHQLSGAADAIVFKDFRIGYGQQRTPITQMQDDDYLIFITPAPSTGAAIGNDRPYPSAITETGFTLNGNAGSWYDVLIFGKVRY